MIAAAIQKRFMKKLASQAAAGGQKPAEQHGLPKVNPFAAALAKRVPQPTKAVPPLAGLLGNPKATQPATSGDEGGGTPPPMPRKPLLLALQQALESQLADEEDQEEVMKQTKLGRLFGFLTKAGDKKGAVAIAAKEGEREDGEHPCYDDCDADHSHLEKEDSDGYTKMFANYDAKIAPFVIRPRREDIHRILCHAAMTNLENE